MKANGLTLLQRLRYWQGQALRSRDFNDQMAFEDTVRIWHNRALHQAYGIREGLEVTLDPAFPGIAVAPGLAYDARGRELIVDSERLLALPEIPSSGLILTISMIEESSSSCLQDRGRACLAGSTPVRLTWESPNRFDPRKSVALARLMPGPVLSLAFVRQRARPAMKPRIGHGSTIPGNTAWRLWKREISEAGFGGDDLPMPRSQVLGLEVDVSTAASGFTDKPCYQAWVEGSLWAPEVIDLIDQRFEAAGSSAYRTYRTPLRLASGFALLQLLELRFGHVHAPTAAGFTYRIWFPQIAKWRQSQSLFEYLLLLAHQGELTVAWVGVQERTDGNASTEAEQTSLTGERR